MRPDGDDMSQPRMSHEELMRYAKRRQAEKRRPGCSYPTNSMLEAFQKGCRCKHCEAYMRRKRVAKAARIEAEKLKQQREGQALIDAEAKRLEEIRLRERKKRKGF